MLEIVFAWLCLSVKDNNWRMLLVLSSVPSFVLLSVIPWLDESPRYYMITNQVEKAVEVLKKASRRNGGKLPKNFKLHKLPQKPRNQHAFFKTLLNDKYRYGETNSGGNLATYCRHSVHHSTSPSPFSSLAYHPAH